MHATPRLASSLTLAAALAFGAALLGPRDAHAQVRASAHLGLERISGGGRSSAMFVGRVEGTVSLIPWLHLGLYAQGLNGGGEGKTGWGGGLLAALRPGIPGTTIDPMGYASVGYQRAPTGAVFNSGPVFEVGGGLSWHILPLIDLEARAGYVGLVGDSTMHGFSAVLGLSLHP